MPFDIATQHELVDLGRDEMEKMGQRFGNRFANLFRTGSDDPANFRFYSSDKSWTTQSTASFRGGLAAALDTTLNQETLIRNDLLRL